VQHQRPSFTSARFFETAPLAGPTVAWPLLAVAVVAHVAWLLVSWLWLFHQPWLDQIREATNGYVGGTLVATLGALAITLAIACGIGRLHPRDVGLSLRGWLVGTAIIAAMWLLTLLVVAVVGTVAIDRARVPELFQQIFGNAPAEEVLFRGFLFAQLARRWPGARGLVLAALISQLIFALSHIPGRALGHNGPHDVALVEDLAWLWWGGLVDCFIYVRTGNLAIVMGIHALGNSDVLLGPSAFVRSVLMWTLLMALWPYLVRRKV
jgi:membrane protease YdiL (CAAX protease family)